MGIGSGLLDFRGNEGFWKAYSVIQKLGIGFSKMVNPTWFATNPPLDSLSNASLRNTKLLMLLRYKALNCQF